MKQLLSLMAAIIVLSLTTGFTVTENSPYDAKTDHKIMEQIARWKYTTWVNPWSNEKAFVTKKNSFVPNFVVYNVSAYPDILLECKLTYSGGEIDLRGPGASVHNIPTGEPVTFHAEIDGSGGHFIVIHVQEMHTLDLRYFDNEGPTAMYEWTPQVGESFYLSIEYF